VGLRASTHSFVAPVGNCSTNFDLYEAVTAEATRFAAFAFSMGISDTERCDAEEKAPGA
jgi:hypothetical protein